MNVSTSKLRKLPGDAFRFDLSQPLANISVFEKIDSLCEHLQPCNLNKRFARIVRKDLGSRSFAHDCSRAVPKHIDLLKCRTLSDQSASPLALLLWVTGRAMQHCPNTPPRRDHHDKSSPQDTSAEFRNINTFLTRPEFDRVLILSRDFSIDNVFTNLVHSDVRQAWQFVKEEVKQRSNAYKLWVKLSRRAPCNPLAER